MKGSTPRCMKESMLYQTILGQGVRVGEIRAARRVLILLGSRKFGEPGPAVVAALNLIQDVDRLETMCDRLIEPNTRDWDDLFRGSWFLREAEEAPHPSVTYEKILREGREIGRFQVARRILRRVGTGRFGEPDKATASCLREIEDGDRLESLGEKLVDFELKTWDELLREA
jgi:hypothetical protein